MKKQLLFVGALATTLSLGCLLAPKTANAATTQIQQETNEDYFVLPNGEHFQTKRTLKNGKILEFYDLELDNLKGTMLRGKLLYNNEVYNLTSYSLELGKGDIFEPGYLSSGHSVYANPITYFPALTATKKVDSLIQKYKDPSKSTLPDSVDKTSELYLDMKSCADEAIKDCKTDYEKIITLDQYVHKVMTEDMSAINTSLETAWKTKHGVCQQYSEIMQRLCQIEGISSDFMQSSTHACVLSYDSQNKRWILSDPMNFCEDFDVYGWANQNNMHFHTLTNLKINNCYFSLNYDKANPEQPANLDSWDEMENWSLNLQGFDYSDGTEITVPSEIDGIPVTNVKRLSGEITSLTLPNTLLSISKEAFQNTPNLKKVVLEDSNNLTSLGNDVFLNCSSLEEVDLSNTKITEIPNGAFNGCTSLKTVKLPNTITKIGDKAFYDCNALTEIDGLDQCRLSSIGSKAFVRCKNLVSLNFSQATFTQLEDEQFTGLAKLESMILPDSLTTLPTKAFYNDTKLKSIKFPSSLTEIGDSALYGCKSITSLDFSNTALTKVGSKALANLPELTEIKFSQGLSSVGTDAFSILNSTDLVPTIIFGAQFNEIGYKGDNTSPWRRRCLDFADEGENYYYTRYYGNGSTGGTGVEPNITFSNSRYTIPECTYTKSNYLFISWNTMADGSGKSYKVGTTTTTPPEKLYAQWKKAKYTINYVFPGATMSLYGDTYEDNCTRTYTFSKVNDPAKLFPTKSDVKKDGYKFLGWYKNENYEGSPISRMDFSTAEDMTLYAKWQYNADHTHKWENGICTICNQHCTHPSTTVIGGKSSTCKEEGYTGDKVCDDCGLTVETGTTLPKTNTHDWDEGTLTKSPTCNTTGEKTKTCKVCGKQETEVIPATGEHQWEEKITKEPTCSQAGEKERTCQTCGKKETETLPVTDTHDWGAGTLVQSPTCTKDGKKIFTCQTCGKTREEILPATGHSPEKQADTPATCTKDGKIGDTVCSKCGELLETGNIIPATGHSWSDWQTTKTPTCNTAGEKERTCKVCGEKEAETLPVTDNHDWDEGTLAQSPTCTEEGKKIFTCKVCGKTKEETLPATGHTEKKEADTPATCDKAGKEGDTICSVCHEILKTGKTIPATGKHDWKETVIKQPTCNTAGEKERICQTCGKKEVEVIPATGEHDWGEETLTQSPTCTEDGKKVFTCQTCGDTKTEIIPAKGHSPKKQTGTPATCTKAGKEGDTVCSECGEILKTGKTIPATGHSWDSGKITKKASYTKTGTKTFTCKKCGEKKYQTIPKLALPKAGAKFFIGGNTYTVAKAGAEVSFSQAHTKAKSVTIPNTVTVSGITYKVTGIKANAFKNCKKLTTVTIGTSVRGIASKAFNNCPQLKKVTIKTVLLTKKTASKKSFNKINKKMVLKVPAKVKKSYAKIFKGFTVK